MKSALLLSTLAMLATSTYAGFASLYTTEWTFKDEFSGLGATVGEEEMTASPETACTYSPAGIKSVAINVKLDFGDAWYCILGYSANECKDKVFRQGSEWNSQHTFGQFHDFPEGVVSAKVVEGRCPERNPQPA